MAMRDSADIGSPCEPVREAQHVLRGIVADVASRESARRRESADSRAAARSREFCDHAAADERDLAIELRREVDEDLHPVDARREGGDDQPAGRAGEDLLERVDDLELRAGEAAAIDVRAVGEQRQHALGAELRRSGGCRNAGRRSASDRS